MDIESLCKTRRGPRNDIVKPELSLIFLSRVLHQVQVKSGHFLPFDTEAPIVDNSGGG